MNEAEKKRLLKTRKKIDKNRPHFKRFESWRFVRIKDQWRKPKGVDNHMRTEEKGWPKSVKIGYRGPADVRGLHASGYEEVMVWNKGDLENINQKTQVARIGGSVGRRKREAIIEKAKVLNINILNSGVKEIEDDFEDLVDENNEDEEIDYEEEEE
jgi:large subunit ribosomal protein L32e